MDAIALICTTIYILGDVLYIKTSRGTYDAAVRRIQGFPIVNRGAIGMAAAVFAYVLLGTGWLVIVPALYDRWRANLGNVLAGAMAGWFYASVVYGIFNLTLYVMLAGWDESIALRDWMWGTVWATAVGAAYGAWQASS
jgi:uncharacterized membrane protein